MQAGELLNNGCGAEFVQKSQKLPRNFEENKSDCAVSGGYCIASFDGDADRLIYSFVDKSGNYYLIDGDKMTSIAALFVIEQLKILGIEDKLSLGAVQTGSFRNECLILFKPMQMVHLHSISRKQLERKMLQQQKQESNIFTTRQHNTISESTLKPMDMELFYSNHMWLNYLVIHLNNCQKIRIWKR